MTSTSPRSTRHLLLSLVLLVMICTVQGCGVVGPPLPPEDIGIEAKIQSQKQAAENQAENNESSIVPLGEEDVTLPPLQPLGAQ
ncbi:MAG: hypothetical protein O2999_12365 [Nitrospirae bacterium]|nr:hypothetical protein [Nitrospirota bacterium]MDA1305067.1 hypothetical protein [Nitrospirota bacterium]